MGVFIKALEYLYAMKNANEQMGQEPINIYEAIQELEELQNNEDLIRDVLLELDLETNFNGYPLEKATYFDEEIRVCLLENEFKRYHKNKNYKLKLIIEEYK